jgi:hypothetical protein
MRLENIVVTVVVFLAPASVIYGWYLFFVRVRNVETGWRSRVTFLSLFLVSLAILMWPVMAVFMPHADPIRNTGFEQQLYWGLVWGRIALIILLLALILGLIGRARLILPIVVACIGTGLFWIFSTVPF